MQKRSCEIGLFSPKTALENLNPGIEVWFDDEELFGTDIVLDKQKIVFFSEIEKSSSNLQKNGAKTLIQMKRKCS